MECVWFTWVVLWLSRYPWGWDCGLAPKVNQVNLRMIFIKMIAGFQNVCYIGIYDGHRLFCSGTARVMRELFDSLDLLDA